MATIRYLPSTHRQNCMLEAWIYAKLSFIEDTHHRWPGARQWRQVRITCHSRNPIISSRFIHFQAEQTNNIVALADFMFILNISVEQTKFPYNGGSISNRNLTITLSIYIYDSGQCKVIHTSSDLHVFWHPRNSKKYMHTDSRLWEDKLGVFYRKLNVATLSQKKFCSFYRFLRYPHCQIMTLFMGYLDTSNLANSQASC